MEKKIRAPRGQPASSSCAKSILETLTNQPGIEIVGEVSDENEIREQVVVNLAGFCWSSPWKRLVNGAENLRYCASRTSRTTHYCDRSRTKP